MVEPHIDYCVCEECKARRAAEESETAQTDFVIIRCRKCHKHMGSIKAAPGINLKELETRCVGCTKHAYCLECKKPFKKLESWGICNDCCDDPMG